MNETLLCVCVLVWGLCITCVCVRLCVLHSDRASENGLCKQVASVLSCYTEAVSPVDHSPLSLPLILSLSLSYTQTHSRVCVCVYPPILKNKCDNVTWISFIKPSLCEQVCWCRVLVRPHLKTWASTLDDEKKKATAQKTAVICPSWGESARTKSSLRTPSQLKHGATRLWRPSLLHPSLPHLL